MNLLKKSICLLNRQIVNKPIFTTNRFYSNEKTNSVEVIKNVEQTQTDEKPERLGYNKAVENHFETGISITSYNTFGFRLNQTVQVIGPIIVFPRTVFSWHVESVQQINSDSLMIFSLVQPRIETLIIGTGEYETTSHIGKSILEIAHKHKINVEVLTTELACTQFNYLNAEGRMLAAALIPPNGTRVGEDDPFNTLDFDSKLFTMESMHTEDLRKLIKKE